MKKIMFNDQYELTDAVLLGRKTMTRRMCKDSATNEVILSDEVDTWLFYAKENLVEFMMKDGSVKVAVLPYKVGDVVAVAQSYKDIGNSREWLEQHVTPSHNSKQTDPFLKKYPGWYNKMFVGADLMPRRIKITDINVERLQDISDEDCIKEGIENNWGYRFKTPHGECVRVNAMDAFACLIDKVSGKGTWEKNPWVFCYSFVLVK